MISGTKRKPEIDMFLDGTATKVQVIEENSSGKPLPSQLLTEVFRFEQEIQALASGKSTKAITKTIVRKPVTKTISAPPTYNKDALDEKKIWVIFTACSYGEYN